MKSWRKIWLRLWRTYRTWISKDIQGHSYHCRLVFCVCGWNWNIRRSYLIEVEVSQWEVEVNIVYDSIGAKHHMETKAEKTWLVEVQTSRSEGLWLDSARGIVKHVSREWEGWMKEDNRVLDLVGTSWQNLGSCESELIDSFLNFLKSLFFTASECICCLIFCLGTNFSVRPICFLFSFLPS